MANNLGRMMPRENRTVEPVRKIGNYNVEFNTNLKDVLGETLWSTYQKTNEITGGVLGQALEDSYYGINIDSGDYGLQFEKNAYIDDMKQDYKISLSKRF